MKKFSRILISLGVSSILIFQGMCFAVGSNTQDIPLTEPTVQVAKTVYKWDEVAEMAIKKNVDFQTTQVDKMKLGRQIDDLTNNVYTIESMGVLTFSDKRDKTDPLIDNLTLLKNNQQSIDENITFKKEVLRDTIKNLYLSIYKYEKQLNTLNDQIKLNNTLLSTDRKKLKLGLISTYDLEKNYNGYQKTERLGNSLKVNIEKLYTSLKNIAGIDSTLAITLDYTFIEQEPILPINYETGWVKMESTNVKIQLYTNAMKRASDFRNGVQNRYPSGDTSFEMADLDYSKAKLTLDNALAELPYKYKNAFDAVMDAYDNYNQKQKELYVKKLEMKNTALKLKNGSASQLEYKIMDTQLKAVEHDLDSARLDYISAKISLESTIKGTN